MGIRIQQLSSAVANQIAAGEVIERPASVVKELLENALDAGATAITIDIGFGGLNHIKISDNGSGIVADDLPLAILQHATSKITQLSDLYAITSMGFRGEALASIAAVSRLSLSSKPLTQDHAMMLRFDGSAYTLSPCARGQGTTVDVRDLFFNASVRKKFLKTPRSEYQAIEMVVKRFALSAPAIAITLRHNDKEILALPAALCEKTKLLRIKKLLGKAFVDKATYLDVEQGGLRLCGWVSGEAYQRSQNDKQWFYINQRMVKDKLINHAIKQAYEPLLHPGRHPSCLLYLTLAASQVDVNVHPTKHEVRFQQPRLIHDFITSNLSAVLALPVKETMTYTPSMPRLSTEVSAHYDKQPLPAIIKPKATALRAWTILNPHFVLAFLHEEPYLIDIARAQQERLLSMLNEQILPLAARPLLVPVRHTFDKEDWRYFEQYQVCLSQLGIALDLVGDMQVVVRSIPQLLPQLDIKQLLQRLNGIIPHQDIVMSLLAACQFFDVYALNQDDMAVLVDYLHEQMLNSNPRLTGCLHLDTEKCRALIHV